MRKQFVAMALGATTTFLGAVVALAAASRVSTEPAPVFVSPYRNGTSAEPPAPVVQAEAASSTDSLPATSPDTRALSTSTTVAQGTAPSSGSGRSSGPGGGATTATSATSGPDATTSTTVNDHGGDDPAGSGGSSGSGSGSSGTGSSGSGSGRSGSGG